MATEISYRPLNENITRLAATSDKSLGLTLIDERKTENLGRQYLLMLIPFGRVYSRDLSRTMENSLYESLAFSYIRPIVSETPRERNQLTVRITEASLSAFDLIFFRVLRNSLQVEVEFANKHGHKVLSRKFQRSETDYRSFGFERQLTELLEENAEALTKEILDTTVLTSRSLRT